MNEIFKDPDKFVDVLQTRKFPVCPECQQQHDDLIATMQPVMFADGAKRSFTQYYEGTAECPVTKKTFRMYQIKSGHNAQLEKNRICFVKDVSRET